MTSASTQNLTCLKCNYPLHTLAPEASCPECGTTVAHSAKNRGLASLPPKLLARASWALYFWAFYMGSCGILSSITVTMTTLFFFYGYTLSAQNNLIMPLYIALSAAGWAAGGWVASQIAGPGLFACSYPPRKNFLILAMLLWLAAFTSPLHSVITFIAPQTKADFPSWFGKTALLLWVLEELVLTLLAARLAWAGHKKALAWTFLLLLTFMIVGVTLAELVRPWLIASNLIKSNAIAYLLFFTINGLLLAQMLGMSIALFLLARTLTRAREAGRLLVPPEAP